MEHGSLNYYYGIEKVENTDMEETEEVTWEGNGHDLPASRQSAGPRPANKSPCGCTGGGNWTVMVIVAGLIGLYMPTSISR